MEVGAGYLMAHEHLHKDEHAKGQPDALDTGVPVATGTANLEGTALNYSRSDHIHAAGGAYRGTNSGSYTKSTPNNTEMAEASLVQVALPASVLAVGSIITMRASGLVTVNSGQPYLDFRLRIGPNAGFASNPQVVVLNTFTSNSTSNAGWMLDSTSITRIKTLGVAGTCRGQMAYFTEMNSQFTYGMEISNTTADTVIDTTVPLYIDVTADWGATGTGHVITWDAVELNVTI